LLTEHTGGLIGSGANQLFGELDGLMKYAAADGGINIGKGSGVALKLASFDTILRFGDLALKGFVIGRRA
jgi:hypothetical protein